MDLSKCVCSEPGFCPIFSRRMGVDPPDWNWCQKTNSKDRESFYNILRKAPPPEKKKLIDLLVKHKDSHQKFFLYYLTLHNKQEPCEDSLEQQERSTHKIWEYICQQEKSGVSFKDIEILSLGHKQEQFDSIQDRSYLTKVNVNDIDAGQWSGNEWAESRAFVYYEKLFKKNTSFIGFTTASWNTKYEAFSRIDNFHNWQHSKVLLRSKPEDNVVLCADIFCVCRWVKLKHNMLHAFFATNAVQIGRNFLNFMKLNFDMHTRVPFSNQIIAHRKTFEKYKQYLNQTEAFSKIDWFVKNIAERYVYQGDHIITNKYYLNRLQAYFAEIVTCFWFANQENMLCIPNAHRTSEWYTADSIVSRI